MYIRMRLFKKNSMGTQYKRVKIKVLFLNGNQKKSEIDKRD